ncbi:Fe(3+) ABC transporter substrate-binding protein [Motilimonas sp. 1_MG-2023]|uniref:Fe(3+) ABC transporter substrate-binding protein n=1 Tax=Motilimonas sp. 1_MG-2023 TaxID=3062672 RepID=UPI0026E1B000|nr:Fe(3+) ABC transporter substrate-binding protein [Motilimonas sp. 1_MG-2023]MDO6524408.1 Fe(3+) ABC transporter substrate-binding protein [Motilimonas sp. 1_MG-2023]
MKKSFILASVVLSSVLASASSWAAKEEVNVYSYRQSFLIEPIMAKFTEETGVKVNIVFAKDGLIERLEREGKLSPADLVLTTDISRSVELVEKDLVQPVQSEALEGNIPAQYRDPADQWFALTTRVRNVYSSKDRLGKQPELNYEDLADAKFKGKICTRSGKHPYNVALISSMIVANGEAETKKWLEGVKANLARKPQGNDRDQVKAIKEGFCDVSLGNNYYLGKMLNDEKQVAWANAVEINFPNQANRGTHVNISGVSLTKFAPNKDNAVKLMEFLSNDTAQKIYAEVNFEYPVKPGVAVSELVSSWGEFKSDTIPLAEIAKQRPVALKLLDEVKFDL